MSLRLRGWEQTLASFLTLFMGLWISAGLPLSMIAVGHFVGILIEVLWTVPYVIGLWLAAFGYGGLIQRQRPWLSSGKHGDTSLKCQQPRWAMSPLYGVVGMAVLLWLLSIVSSFSLAWATCVPVCGLILFITWLWQAIRDDRMIKKNMRRNRKAACRFDIGYIVFVFCLSPFLIAALCVPGTMWPTEAYGFDVLTYQLQVPRQWIQQGYVSGLEHNVYSFLPGLLNVGYAWLGMRIDETHGVEFSITAIRASSMFHTSMAVMAALVIGQITAAWSGRKTLHRWPFQAWLAASLFIVIPWVMITATLAYNEMGVCLFGVAALAVLIQSRRLTWWLTATLMGLLLGAATMSKLTALLLVVVPLAVIATVWFVFRLSQSSLRLSSKRYVLMLALTILCFGLYLSPYLLRNGVSTSNPVFPFMTEVFGTGHWTEQQVQRWNTAHDARFSGLSLRSALDQQWLRNAGFGAIGGTAIERDVQNMARFETEGGWPVLWMLIAANCAGILLLSGKGTSHRFRYVYLTFACLLVLLLLQLAMWGWFTHLQSRFLLPTLLPGLLLLGLAMGVSWRVNPRWRTLSVAAGLIVLAVLWVSSVMMLQRSSRFGSVVDSIMIAEALPHAVTHRVIHGDTPLPWRDTARHDTATSIRQDQRVLLIPGTEPLLYIQIPFEYASVFDRHPLSDVIAEVGTERQAVLHALQERGYDRVAINGAELARLRATYDPPVAREVLEVFEVGPDQYHVIDLYRLKKQSQPTR